MARILEGSRVGRTAKLKVGCCAAIFDESGGKLLLTRRTDNGQWCLPGGAMDPGESASEACVREVLEETSLRVTVRKLVGVYSSPDRIVVHADGNRFQHVSIVYEVLVEGGGLVLDHESTEAGYFSQAEVEGLDLIENQRERMPDIFAGQDAAFAR